MTKRFARWMLGLALAGATGTGLAVPIWVHAQARSAAAQPQQLATVDELKAEAFKALKAGQFDRSSELLTKASAANAGDVQLTKMAQWTK
ncbi:MAG TPA: hypothetical protein VH475_06605, partial [Tepidisphaeraceae bacterium]